MQTTISSSSRSSRSSSTVTHRAVPPTPHATSPFVAQRPLLTRTSMLLAACLGLVACGGELPAQPVGAPRPQEVPVDERGPAADVDRMHAVFDALLQRHVRDERVDYLSWRDADAAELRRYLDQLAEVAVDSLPQADRLAFYINLYNATMIDAILPRVDAAYSTAADEWAIFDAPLVRQGERSFSLNHLEHEIVRKQFAEPRIHVALVCGAVSCPPLSPRAFRGQGLDAVLETSMRAFVNDGVRNVIAAGKTKLSKLFEWYADDFGGAAGVPAYVTRYLDPSNPVGAVSEPEFLEYSWQLNLATPAEGQWMRCVRASKGLAVGAICRVKSADDDRVELVLPFARGTLSVARDSVVAWP